MNFYLYIKHTTATLQENLHLWQHLISQVNIIYYSEMQVTRKKKRTENKPLSTALGVYSLGTIQALYKINIKS